MILLLLHSFVAINLLDLTKWHLLHYFNPISNKPESSTTSHSLNAYLLDDTLELYGNTTEYLPRESMAITCEWESYAYVGVVHAIKHSKGRCTDGSASTVTGRSCSGGPGTPINPQPKQDNIGRPNLSPSRNNICECLINCMDKQSALQKHMSVQQHLDFCTASTNIHLGANFTIAAETGHASVPIPISVVGTDSANHADTELLRWKIDEMRQRQPAKQSDQKGKQHQRQQQTQHELLAGEYQHGVGCLYNKVSDSFAVFSRARHDKWRLGLHNPTGTILLVAHSYGQSQDQDLNQSQDQGQRIPLGDAAFTSIAGQVVFSMLYNSQPTRRHHRGQSNKQLLFDAQVFSLPFPLPPPSPSSTTPSIKMDTSTPPHNTTYREPPAAASAAPAAPAAPAPAPRGPLPASALVAPMKPVTAEQRQAANIYLCQRLQIAFGSLTTTRQEYQGSSTLIKKRYFTVVTDSGHKNSPLSLRYWLSFCGVKSAAVAHIADSSKLVTDTTRRAFCPRSRSSAQHTVSNASTACTDACGYCSTNDEHGASTARTGACGYCSMNDGQDGQDGQGRRPSWLKIYDNSLHTWEPQSGTSCNLRRVDWHLPRPNVSYPQQQSQQQRHDRDRKRIEYRQFALLCLEDVLVALAASAESSPLAETSPRYSRSRSRSACYRDRSTDGSEEGRDSIDLVFATQLGSDPIVFNFLAQIQTRLLGQGGGYATPQSGMHPPAGRDIPLQPSLQAPFFLELRTQLYTELVAVLRAFYAVPFPIDAKHIGSASMEKWRQPQKQSPQSPLTHSPPRSATASIITLHVNSAFYPFSSTTPTKDVVDPLIAIPDSDASSELGPVSHLHHPVAIGGGLYSFLEIERCRLQIFEEILGRWLRHHNRQQQQRQQQEAGGSPSDNSFSAGEQTQAQRSRVKGRGKGKRAFPSIRKLLIDLLLVFDTDQHRAHTWRQRLAALEERLMMRDLENMPDLLVRDVALGVGTGSQVPSHANRDEHEAPTLGGGGGGASESVVNASTVTPLQVCAHFLTGLLSPQDHAHVEAVSRGTTCSDRTPVLFSVERNNSSEDIREEAGATKVFDLAWTLARWRHYIDSQLEAAILQHLFNFPPSSTVPSKRTCITAEETTGLRRLLIFK